MKSYSFLKLMTVFALAVIVYAGCKKEDKVVTPPSLVHFTNISNATYFVTGPNVTYKIPIGLSTVSDKDRTITINVSSPTGAVQGTQYTLSTTSLVIPAGKALDSVEVKAVYDQYTAGRKDTLVFTLSGPDVTPADYNPKLTLLMRGPCFDGDVEDINVLLGDYKNTFEDGGSYGPYTATITELTKTSATTATGKANNIFDYFGPITLNFDWSDPNNTIVTIPLQQTDKSYAAGQPFLIRTSPGQSSTFSVCRQEISLMVDVIVNNYPAPGSAAYYSQDDDIVLKR